METRLAPELAFIQLLAFNFASILLKFEHKLVDNSDLIKKTS